MVAVSYLVHHELYYKMRQLHYKMRQLLQNAKFNTKWVNTDLN